MASGYNIKGIEPFELRQYPTSVKLMYWSWVVELGLQAKESDLAQGFDAFGEPLRPISDETRKHRKSAMTPGGIGDPYAPPLSPGHQLSRTRSLLAGRALVDRAEFWWRFDPFTHASWSKILTYQQEEQGRDVFGLSPDATAWVQMRALGNWMAWLRAGAVAPAELEGKRVVPPLKATGTEGPVVEPVMMPGKPIGPTAVFGISRESAAGLQPGQWSGGFTEAEMKAYFRQKAPAAVQGREGKDYNVLLQHIWGKPQAPFGVVEPIMPPKPPPLPRPPKPKPPPKPKMTPLERIRGQVEKARLKQEAAHGGPQVPDMPIGQRIEASTLGDAKIKAVKDYAAVVNKETKKQVDKLQKEHDRLQVVASGQNKEWHAINKEMIKEGILSKKTGNRGFVEEAMRRSDEALARLTETRKTYDTLDVQIKDLRRNAAKRAIEAIHLDPKAAIKFNWTSADVGAASRDGPLLAPYKSEDHKTLDEAMNWLSRLVGKGKGRWDDVLEMKVGVGKGYRAHHRNEVWVGNPYHVQIKEGETTSTVIHEYGHGIDARVRGEGLTQVGERSREFLQHRVGSEPRQKFQDLFPDAGYDDDEYGRGDDFAKAHLGDKRKAFYAGKEYNNKTSSEVLSMGVELLYHDPVAFSETDPEWFKFVVGVLDGSLR